MSGKTITKTSIYCHVGCINDTHQLAVIATQINPIAVIANYFYCLIHPESNPVRNAF